MASKIKCDVPTVLSKSVILRLALGGMLLLFGYSKLQGGTAAFVEAMTPAFADTVLPAGLVNIVLTVMPTVETVLGSLLLLGLFTSATARFAALLFAVYILGLIAQNNPANAIAVVANFIYIFAAFKIVCGHHSPISLDHLIRCKGGSCPA